MSFKVVVKTAGDTDWVSNGIRFASRDEADSYGFDLAWRWLAVTEWEVQESTEQVNYQWNEGKLQSLARADGGE